jgi:hypothetical protein
VTAFPTALVKLVVYEDEHRLTGSHRHGHEEARPLAVTMASMSRAMDLDAPAAMER